MVATSQLDPNLLVDCSGGGGHGEPVRLHAGQPAQQAGAEWQQTEVANHKTVKFKKPWGEKAEYLHKKVPKKNEVLAVSEKNNQREETFYIVDVGWRP